MLRSERARSPEVLRGAAVRWLFSRTVIGMQSTAHMYGNHCWMICRRADTSQTHAPPPWLERVCADTRVTKQGMKCAKCITGIKNSRCSLNGYYYQDAACYI
ncbi:hypothetical protein DBV15_01675 [Temnothorax longispinosus]|uniref:Uncharacterized protein n=1 Tax=Temnothorax longispinosus TaxID=300112 RepID=A0A4S2L0J3_9HYME|nr:hypothetical protein DBV15_01675 [Temnothorax longispinosus]